MSYYEQKNIPGPDNILRKEFTNGITLLAHENSSSHTAVVQASLPCGSYLDPMDKTGLADFAASCLNHGTQTHNFDQLSELLEGSGASLGIGCGPRAFTLRGTCLAEDLPMLLGLIREILDEPFFTANHVEIHRQRVLSSYELHLHDPESMANEVFDRVLFGDHPYGRPEFGTIDEINSITRDDLFRFHQRYIGPKGMIAAVSGGLPAELIMDEWEKVFGTWQKPCEPISVADYFPPVLGPEKSYSTHIEIPEKSEMALILGTMAPRRGSADHTAALLGNSILGEFGMMGRIGKAVREENGLAYYAGSSLTSLTYGGCWTVEAGVNPANAEKAIDLITKELRRFTSEEVTAEELDDVKSFYLGSTPLLLESNNGIASLMLNMETHHFGLDHLIRLPDRIKSVTGTAILETARKWIDPDKLILVTAGTKGDSAC